MIIMSELEEKVKNFAIDEGILGKRLKANPKVEFAYELKFPPNSTKPMKLMLIKPKDLKCISIQAPTQIAKIHVDAFAKMGNNMILQFYNILKKYVLTQNLLYNINVKQSRYVILENIYPDGLTEDRFYLALRKVFNAAVFCSVTLNEILARGGALKSNVKALSDPDFSSGDTMFT
jgi:hypothetical protein